MSNFQRNFQDTSFVERYTMQGPPAFMPGHAGMLRMTAVLLRERAPADARVLVVGAGGGLETRALALAEPAFRFVGVDPAPAMLELARDAIGSEIADRVDLIEGTTQDAPRGPFEAATCILVLGLLDDDGAKRATLEEIHRRLRPGAPFVLVDQCLDRSSPDFEHRLDRYARYARASGVDDEIVESAKAQLRSHPGLVPPERNESLLEEAGFRDSEVFFVGMAWRGWLATA